MPKMSIYAVPCRALRGAERRRGNVTCRQHEITAQHPDNVGLI